MKRISGFAMASGLLTRPFTSGGYDASPVLRHRIREVFGRSLTVEQAVARILADVRGSGDSALRDYTLRTDGVWTERIEVDEGERDAALKKVDRSVFRALEVAAERIRDFHQVAREHSLSDFRHNGLGQMVRPLERVGLYVPGGTAAYPSTVLMTAIPARVAGVGEVVLATPPAKSGGVPAVTLAAASLAGVDRVFKVGGAQAIAALAFGTETVPRVDKICGPGNIFVVLAKKMVFGEVAIDGLQGPSEVVVIADGKANAGLCAAEMIAQAEHDAMASAVLITTSKRLASEVERALTLAVNGLGRRSIIAKALESNGCIVVVKDMSQAIELAALFAPEHLSLMVQDADEWATRTRNAGAVFVGPWSPVVMGDYAAGPSHVLPTGGTARFSSPLGVTDFLRVSNLVCLDGGQFELLGPTARALAEAEGLQAHALSVEMRLPVDPQSESQIASRKPGRQKKVTGR